ncbi:MAG: efflux RND transporter periplasmic adaptor subunit [Thermoguttaceae bacterium]|jgi:RND family efflux transporter MFP subunit
MNKPGLPWRRLVVPGCLCAAVGGALVFGYVRRGIPGKTAAGAEQAEYLETISPAGPPGRSAAAGGIRKQAVEAVTRKVTLRLTGSLAADEKSDVGSNAMGNISETCVERGSIVKKGDLLVQIDPRDAQYALDEGVVVAEELRVRLGLDEGQEFRVDDVPEVEAAKLAREMAERSYRRSESLKQRRAIALGDAEQMETDYRSAVQRHRLAVRQARQLYQNYRQAVVHLVALRKAVDDCSIRAPFDGWVAERDISAGERVIALFPGAKLVTLLRIDPLRLQLTVPQQELAHIKLGQTVTFRTDAFPGKTFTGSVRYIAPAVTSDNRSLCVEAVVANPRAVLRPGLFVTAELQLDEQQTDFFVPRAAVCSRGEVAAVFVVRGGVIREQIVSLGETAGGRVRITSGLAADDIVVTTPDKVRDGDTES